jgi:putative two-component system response regulator
MVVDDDAVARNAIGRTLRARGYDVRLEADGRGAVESARRLQPDVVLLDVNMPGMSGMEVCRELRSDPETRFISILMLTGLSTTERLVEALDAGADDFLGKPPDPVELLARVRSLVRSKQATDELVRVEAVVLSLARSVESKDPCTEGHCERLAKEATRLAGRLGLPRADLDALRIGGILHDIGKMAVPDAILLKPGDLTPEEWHVMREHPLTGVHICGPIRSFSKVMPIIRHHHERWDGSGYPDGLRGEDIPVTARVLQVVDIYDALTSERPYKGALTATDALDLMRAEVAMGWWDTRIFAEFETMTLAGGSLDG